MDIYILSCIGKQKHINSSYCTNVTIKLELEFILHKFQNLYTMFSNMKNVKFYIAYFFIKTKYYENLHQYFLINNFIK